MKSALIKVLKIVLPLGVGIYLTWYFLSRLSDEDIQQTKDAFFEADYFWVILSLLAAFLSHLSRAYRWLFLLEPLGYKPKLSSAFYAVMSGYVINYTVPRSGEVARAGLLASAEGVAFEKGFATIVVERVIDVIMLGIVVMITGILQVNSDGLKQITRSESAGSSNLYLILGLIAVIFGIIFIVLYKNNGRFRNFFHEKLKGFWEGLKSVWFMKKKWAFLAHTLFIWICYVGMIWIGAQAFTETASMPIGCIFGAFVVGATAIALLPGGIGVYPLWITEVLALYEIDFAAFGIFVWVVQTALIVILGLISLFLIQRRIKV